MTTQRLSERFTRRLHRRQLLNRMAKGTFVATGAAVLGVPKAALADQCSQCTPIGGVQCWPSMCTSAGYCRNKAKDANGIGCNPYYAAYPSSGGCWQLGSSNYYCCDCTDCTFGTSPCTCFPGGTGG